MRFAFLVCHPYQTAMLRPFHEHLRGRHECLLCNTNEDAIAFAPDVLVQCEGSGTICALRAHLPRAIMIHLRHGLACKTVSYAAARGSDYTIATSAWMRDWFRSRGATPRRAFWTTGFPPLDPLFHTQHSGVRPALEFLDPARPMVLYAPTYDQKLSSIPMVAPDAGALRPRGRDAQVVIKPHPHTARHFGPWLRAVEENATGDADLHLLNAHCDITPYLQNADVLVTDVSSTSLAYLALDRPVIQVTPPEATLDPHFDGDAPEWQWRDMGDELQDLAGLPDAIGAALAEPGRHAERRGHYRELLFGDLDDGRAAERVRAHLDELRPQAVRGQWF